MTKKLIEVALPLDEINAASAREKNPFLRRHPRSIHIWWARRPLVAARAVIFSSLITDPSDPEYPWLEGQERDIEGERERLHRLIVELVQWENSTNEIVLGKARTEILRHTNNNPPPLLDPFAGGGAIPLEAQRLGLEAHASDLNPVAVLINKAMIEIPPRFADQAPVNPGVSKHFPDAKWEGAAGLAEDVRYYGKWVRDEAERRIGHLYPKAHLPKDQGGAETTCIAWLWARSIQCPNPACGAEMPLVTSYWLSTKQGKEAWLSPIVNGSRVKFEVHFGKGEPPSPPKQGRGAKFKCIVCGNSASDRQIKSYATTHGLGFIPMAAVVRAGKGKSYLSPEDSSGWIYSIESQDQTIDLELPARALGFGVQPYGMTHFSDLFTERQLRAMSVMADCAKEVSAKVLAEAAKPLDQGAHSDMEQSYADAVATYVGLAVSRNADLLSTCSGWNPENEQIRALFSRQAIQITWDFAELNPFAGLVGVDTITAAIADALTQLPLQPQGAAFQRDARLGKELPGTLVSTDPPYYDNIGYADLSDFFYVWLQRSLGSIWPELLAGKQTPKQEELIANPFLFEGGKPEAKLFFEKGLESVFRNLATFHSLDYPMTVYYAFKQVESEALGDSLTSVLSTGWETMLEGLISAGFQITATWPVRTERAERVRALESNALASSVVLACRVRTIQAPEISRQQFLRELRQRLAADLRPLQQSSIAPVDLAQAAIGPGMAVYSQYSQVREATGEPLRVRAALGLINQVLDEVLAEQDEEYDRATRWAVTWYEQHGFAEGPYGDAETLARARDVAVDELAHDGLVRSGRGKVRLTRRDEYPELPEDWQPRIVDVYDWQIMQRLAQAALGGQAAAAAVMARIDRAMPGRTELAKELAYRVHSIADRKGWTGEALVYNTLVQNWPEIERLARDLASASQTESQGRLL